MLPVDPSSRPATHVVAAVMADPEGRILLARRVGGRDWNGTWEFPGGKVEPGEAPLRALARELDEEIGVDIDPASCEPLICVPCAYAGKRIRLDVHRVARWSGTPRGREKQALAWVPTAALSSYDMPAADRPAVAALQQPPHYLITPEPEPDDLLEPTRFLARIEAALASGVARVQLRVRQGGADPVACLAEALAGVCAAASAQLLVNSRIPGAYAIAERLGLGLHLTASDLIATRPGASERGRVVAASCHDARELAHAEALGLEFVVLGPVLATDTHPGAPTLGWEGFARLREHCSLPIYAVGGLGMDDVAVARRHGAQGIAGIRTFLGPGGNHFRPGA